MRYALFLAACLLSSNANANDIDPMGNGWYPSGFPAYCERIPEDCFPVKAARISYASNHALLEAVNVAVNRSIEFRDDEPGLDLWVDNPRFGDCEDYAVTKMHRLVEAGVPRGAMRLAFGDLANFGKHTTLLVWTDQGEFVLDNNTDEVVELPRMMFDTLSIQDAANPYVWWQTD